MIIGLRQKANDILKLRYCGEHAERFVPLDGLLVWLCAEAGVSCQGLARNLVCWLGWVIDMGGLWGHCSTDALLHAPVPMAKHRARRIDSNLRQAIAKAIAGRAGGRIGGPMSNTMMARSSVET